MTYLSMQFAIETLVSFCWCLKVAQDGESNEANYFEVVTTGWTFKL